MTHMRTEFAIWGCLLQQHDLVHSNTAPLCYLGKDVQIQADVYLAFMLS